MTRPDRLDVYFGAEHVGTIHDASPLAFEYAATWLERAAPMAVAAIALQPGRQDSTAVQAFFENLLPEGELRDYLAAQRKASTLFSLLLEVAGDTAGGFVIVPGGEEPQPPAYEPTTWQAIAAILRKKSAAAIDLQGEGARISLAGAQDKTSIAIFDDGVPRLPKGASPSTHILKPNIKRLAKVWHSAANETIVMRMASHCGLPTAEVFYEPHTESCVVTRFDRIKKADGTLARLVQYDLCQLAGTASDRKYEKEGGPGLPTCAELIRRYSTQPALDLRRFVDWTLFNLYVGNNDSHAKNLSLYAVPGQGVLLTPFYDLMCTRLYPGLSQEFAFSIGGEFKPGSMTRQHLEALASQLGMRPQFFVRQAAELAEKVPVALHRALEETQPALSHSARALASKLAHFVESTTKKTAARFSH
ncbi:MAG: type II toxin-antitoxin system HipA family toxin [Aquincola sp.]|nr:type II toxin-antitoxin system HipA family toxin [Aquincola sp.]